MNFLINTFPKAQIVFFTPAHCFIDRHTDDIPSSRPMKKQDAIPLSGYVKIIEESGARCGIPVCRMAEKLALDPSNAATREKYMPDGLHFNDAGHALLAHAIAEYLLSL